MSEYKLRRVDDNIADYNAMLKLREGYIMGTKLTDTRLLLAVGKAWTWGWVNGLDYFDKEKKDGDTLQGRED